MSHFIFNFCRTDLEQKLMGILQQMTFEELYSFHTSVKFQTKIILPIKKENLIGDEKCIAYNIVERIIILYIGNEQLLNSPSSEDVAVYLKIGNTLCPMSV